LYFFSLIYNLLISTFLLYEKLYRTVKYWLAVEIFVLLYLTLSWIYIASAVLYSLINIKSFDFNLFKMIFSAFASAWSYFSICSTFYKSFIRLNLLVRLSTLLVFIFVGIVVFPFLLSLAALFSLWIQIYSVLFNSIE